jgi:hypothetical protein
LPLRFNFSNVSRLSLMMSTTQCTVSLPQISPSFPKIGPNMHHHGLGSTFGAGSGTHSGDCQRHCPLPGRLFDQCMSPISWQMYHAPLSSRGATIVNRRRFCPVVRSHPGFLDERSAGKVSGVLLRRNTRTFVMLTSRFVHVLTIYIGVS